MDQEKRAGMRKRLIEKMGRVRLQHKSEAITRVSQGLSSCPPLESD